RYATAGLEYKGKLINEAVELFGYHRKSAIRALRRAQSKEGVFHVRGRSREYCPEQLLKPLKGWQHCSPAASAWYRRCRSGCRPMSRTIVSWIVMCGKVCFRPVPRRWTGYSVRLEPSLGGGVGPGPGPCCGRRFRSAPNGWKREQ